MLLNETYSHVTIVLGWLKCQASQLEIQTLLHLRMMETHICSELYDSKSKTEWDSATLSQHITVSSWVCKHMYQISLKKGIKEKSLHKQINGLPIFFIHPETIMIYHIPIDLIPPTGKSSLELCHTRMMGLD